MVTARQQVTTETLTPIIDWIDREVRDGYERRSEKRILTDVLLELRHHFSTCPLHSHGKLVAGFYALLPRLEQSHYLLGYRIRQWFSSQFTVQLSDPLERVAPFIMPLEMGCKSLDELRKSYFEASDYEVPYHDIRLRVL